MKKNKKPDKSKVSVKIETEKITREEAIKKVGKYAAFTAAATLTILSPKEAQAGSVPTAPGW